MTTYRDLFKAYQKYFKQAPPNFKSNTEGATYVQYAYQSMHEGSFSISDTYFKLALITAEYGGEVYARALHNYAQLMVMQKQYKKAILVLNQCLNTIYGRSKYIEIHTLKIKIFGLLGQKNDQRAIYKYLLSTVVDVKLIGNRLEEAKFNLFVKQDDDYTEGDYFVAPSSPTLSNKVEFKKGGAVANKKIKKGDVILVENPMAICSTDYCYLCYKTCDILVPCQLCEVIYCSEDCRAKDKKYHQFECNFHRCNKSGFFSSNAFLYLRIYITNFITVEKDEKIIFQSFNSPDTLNKMVMGTPLSRARYNEEFIQKINILLTSYIVQTQPRCLKFIKEIYAFFVNYVGVWEKRLTTIKESKMFYLNLSLFDHSCKANTIKYAAGAQMVVKAAEDILPGQKIYVNYCPKLMPKRERQNYLQKTYFYECKCNLCSDPTDISLKNIIRCPNCNDYSSFQEEKIFCEKCNRSSGIPFDVFIYIKRIYELVSISESRQDITDLKNAINLGEKIMLNPSHSIIATAYFQLARHLIKNGQLKSAIDCIQNIKIDSFNFIYYLDIIHMLNAQLGDLFKREVNPYDTSEITLKTVKKYLNFMNEMKLLVQMYYPKKYLLDITAKLEKFYTIQKSIVEFEKSNTWVKPDTIP